MTYTVARPATVVRNFIPDSARRRVLLVNPPVYDTRFPWSQWHQPVKLLQLATLLRGYNCDVRLVDTLSMDGQDLPRRLIRVLDRGETEIKYWRFGVPRSVLSTQLRNLSVEHWDPDEVYIEGFTTYWWEGVREAILEVRTRFPGARIVVVGAYAQYATNHAACRSGADIVVQGSISNIAGLPIDTSLYQVSPSFSYISLGGSGRDSDDVLEDIIEKAAPASDRKPITSFAFADHDVAGAFPERFRAVLRRVIDLRLKIKFFALGNIYAQDIIADPDLIFLMRRAGFKQIVFADDREIQPTDGARANLVVQLERAAQLCRRAGYATGTETLTAQVCIGRPDERLEDVTGFMAEVAHAVGSLIPVPYQPIPEQCPEDMPLELQNGKVFPFAERNGLTYRAYQDVIGLAAILNAKYRSTTFDFLGDGLIARLVQTSLETRSWDPRLTDSLVPKKPIIVGYFNKEGKWVRS